MAALIRRNNKLTVRRWPSFIGVLDGGSTLAGVQISYEEKLRGVSGLALGTSEPFRVDGDGMNPRTRGVVYWIYGDQVHESREESLTSEDVLALINEEQNKLRLRLEKAHALQAMRRELDTKGKRAPIPQDVKVAVWQRDGGRCVECGAQEELEFDHIIPLAMGGANTLRNLQLLCGTCNRRKGATLG